MRAMDHESIWSPPSYQSDFLAPQGFSYSQTVSYLYRLQVARHDRTHFNNRGTINWSVVSLSGIESARPRNEPGLQLVDCAASGIFRAIDENWFGQVRPDYLRSLGPRFIRISQAPRDYGFKLLPDGFVGPLSAEQQLSLRALGYTFPVSKR